MFLYPSGFARFRFMRCAAAGHYNCAVVFAPVPRQGPAHLTSTGGIFFYLFFLFIIPACFK